MAYKATAVILCMLYAHCAFPQQSKKNKTYRKHAIRDYNMLVLYKCNLCDRKFKSILGHINNSYEHAKRKCDDDDQITCLACHADLNNELAIKHHHLWAHDHLLANRGAHGTYWKSDRSQQAPSPQHADDAPADTTTISMCNDDNMASDMYANDQENVILRNNEQGMHHNDHDPDVFQAIDMCGGCHSTD